jgi:hypothetical protein
MVAYNTVTGFMGIGHHPEFKITGEHNVLQTLVCFCVQVRRGEAYSVGSLRKR